MPIWCLVLLSVIVVVVGDEHISQSQADQDAPPTRLGSQGLLALERAATKKYSPEIAAGGAARVVDAGGGPDDLLLLFMFVLVCIAVLFFTKTGQEFSNSVPMLRPLAQHAAKLSASLAARRSVQAQKKSDVEMPSAADAECIGAVPAAPAASCRDVGGTVELGGPASEDRDTGELAGGDVTVMETL
eukprot:gnl/TRDRNA2_/TRDRNA2_128235_c0_seq1.p1 gnl/TRDRNA2_/TRDRNA2_128235_c0~~gnl/TRDRNA2_/TRDRNA2_128235_c0_seq1.p1  ORF type:complete len:187 (+),score=40.94 gnl/TRDRNA2_/TRDRNA2_128235_c0_seq1:78-638(+)